MSTISLPSSSVWKIAEAMLKLEDFRFTSESVFTRSQQQYPAAGGWFWSGYVKLIARDHDLTADLEGWLDQACEAGNLVAMPHPRWREPRGTMRGSPTLTGAHAAGVSTLAIHASAGVTLKRGDLIGLAGHLLRVQSDITFDGSGNASVVVRGKLRSAFSDGAAVTWSAPTTTFQIKQPPDPVYMPGYGTEITLDLVERWT